MSDINLCDCEENWIEIKNKKNNLYLLSSKGRLYSYHSERFIGDYKENGYIKTSGFFTSKIHRLVFHYFNKNKINIKNYDRKLNEIDHINTIRHHNCICNLRCCSRSENNNNILTRKKNSESRKGKITWMKGKKHSQKSKQKISEKKKGIYKKNKKASLSIRKIGKKKYIIRYNHKGKQYNLYFYTEEEQKECELLINELYKDNILL